MILSYFNLTNIHHMVTEYIMTQLNRRVGLAQYILIKLTLLSLVPSHLFFDNSIHIMRYRGTEIGSFVALTEA